MKKHLILFFFALIPLFSISENLKIADIIAGGIQQSVVAVENEGDDVVVGKSNLVNNPSFEEWENDIPTNWVGIAHNAVVSKSSDASSGNYSIEVGGSAGNKRLASQTYTLTAGTYTFSANVKQTGDAIGMFRLGYVNIIDGKAGTYIYATETAAVSSIWTEVSCEFTLNEITDIELIIWNSKTGLGAPILVDDIVLTSIDGNEISEGTRKYIDGIGYKLTAKTNEAEVTSGKTKYSGAITIPATVTYEGVPYSVTSIGSHAFDGCSSLTAITIPESVTGIGQGAFTGCSSLTAITIPEGVTWIGYEAFYYCTRLHTLTIGSNVSTIGTDAFKTTSLTKVIWLTNTPPTGYTYANGVVNYVPNNQYTNLKNQMVYPYLNSCFSVGGVTYVPNPTDKLCDVINCTYDSYNSSVAIDSTVIYHGIALKVNEIMPYAFYKNIHMNEITIDNGVGSIGEKAFYQCENISSITIGNGAEKIEAEAFYECKKLTNVTIGNGLKNINSKAFYGCGALKSFKVGRSLESIGDNAFFGCSAIEQFVCHAKQPPLCGEMAIYDIDKWNCTLKVPSKAVDRYKNADQWAGFFFTEGFEVKPNIVTFMVDGLLHETVEVEYGEEIPLSTTPEKEGHTFTGWTDMPTIMPANDIVVHGEFAKNKYNVEFIIDGKVHHSDEILYGDTIELIDEPTKEGYTFSGWSKAPETMPAEDVTISGTFTINKYLVTFKIDDEVIASDSLEYGANIVVPEAPEKEGYTFNGWGEVIETVPASDVTYGGSYTINTYKVYYYVDEELVHTAEVTYGEPIPEYIYEPTAEGDEFLGWIGETYATMPAHDVTYTANIESGINQITIDNGYPNIYDLTGRKVNIDDLEELSEGIYIINGRKVVVKIGM